MDNTSKKTKFKILIAALSVLTACVLVFNIIVMPAGIQRFRSVFATKAESGSGLEADAGKGTTEGNGGLTDEQEQNASSSDDDANQNDMTEQSGENVTDPDNDEQITPDETSSDSATGSTTQGTTEKSTQPVTSAGYTVTFSVANSWEQDGYKCYQLVGTLKNNSSVSIGDWKVVKNIAGVSVQSNWNCTCSVSGSTLTISPAEYNGVVESGAQVNDIGVIIKCNADLSGFTYDGSTGNIVASGDGGNSGGSQNGGSSETVTEPVEVYTPPVLEAGTPVGNHGQLSVSGTGIVDKNGQKYQLKGVSTHGVQWFPEYINKQAIQTLRDDWGANLFRIALYTHEGGYCSGGDKSKLEEVVYRGVDACTELGMYVIIDWHVLNEQDPNKYISDAKTFFDKVSKRYSNNVNVIYEICNEPNGGVSWDRIKQYADTIIPIIRKNSPDALIIVGTPTWSQEVDKVAANPVSNPHNVLYAVHFYAATHKEWLRNTVAQALKAGTPVFVSEFSICDASGNGGIDYTEAEAWKNFMNNNNLSYAGWSLCNKNETSALIKAGNSKLFGWGTNDLSNTGIWLRKTISGQ